MSADRQPSASLSSVATWRPGFGRFVRTPDARDEASRTCAGAWRALRAGVRYDRTVIAYHGCDVEVAERLLRGEPFRTSQNDYDWLGTGIYFWEYGADRALRFAEDQRRRGKVTTPSIVGALVQLGHCFDLMDTAYTRELEPAFDRLCALHLETGQPMPVNGGSRQPWPLRKRDCAVLNLYLGTITRPYDTVRCGFVEGPPAFEGSGISMQSHVQLAVRNPACIVGVFRPTLVS